MEKPIIKLETYVDEEYNYVEPDLITIKDEVKEETLEETLEPTNYCQSNKATMLRTEENADSTSSQYLNSNSIKTEIITEETVSQGTRINLTTKNEDFRNDVDREKKKKMIPKNLIPDVNTKLFKCPECPYDIASKDSIKLHMVHCHNYIVADGKIYLCDDCDYKTFRKSNYKRHLQTHLSKERCVHKCLECNFECTDEFVIYRHVTKHQSSNRAEGDDCPQCGLQEFHSNMLESKIPCPPIEKSDKRELYYQKCQKSDKVHIFSNDGSREASIYKCTVCTYQTKRKGNLTHHSLRHKSSSELEMFSCNTCSYQSFNKSHLQTHILTHKSEDEVQLYRCNQCKYHSKYKADLKIHLLRHKKRSEAATFRCTQCSYKALRKYDLNRHLLRHNGSQDVKKHQCPYCEYQTVEKGNLNKHIFRHHSNETCKK